MYCQLYTPTRHLMRYTLLVLGWSPFSGRGPKASLNSSWHRYSKVLETRLRHFGLYWNIDMTASHICLRFVSCASMTSMNLRFHRIPELLCWFQIRWLWRPFEYTELAVGVWETSWRWFELWDMMCCPAESSYHKRDTHRWSYSGGHGWQQYPGRLWCLKGPKVSQKYSPLHCYTTTSSLNGC